MTDPRIVELAISYGIEPDYFQLDGSYHAAEEKVLTTFTHMLQDNRGGVYAQVFPILCESPTVLVVDVELTPEAKIRLLGESGQRIEVTHVDYHTRQLHIPSLRTGYYDLVIEHGNEAWHGFVIAAPDKVYETDALHNGERLTGITLQLYSLRSPTNWGIGDFGDLKDFMSVAGTRGLTFVGINPLHALFSSHPHWASPYSPSSRIWLNPIYLDMQQVPGLSQSQQAKEILASETLQQALAGLRDSETVDYWQVWQCKQRALKLAFAAFCDPANSVELSDALASFDEFVHKHGENLRGFALFEALDQVYADPDDAEQPQVGWQAWPAEYQDPDSEAVRAFAERNPHEITFYMWLQWLCAEQLKAVQQAAQSAGVSMGVYGDLAVGVARGGADTWFHKSAYCLDVSVGAPPDPLGPAGQNWGLPPWHPRQLEQSGFAIFIELMRMNMARYGVLRIDHVMGLCRLWWVMSGKSALHGAYVQYPLEAMLAILAIESHRQRCVVIGEDLGIVPERLRRAIRRYGVYTYSVMYFSRSDYGYLLPQDYPEQAIAVTSTHDLAPLAGYWIANDLHTMRRLGVFPDDEQFAQTLSQREADKQALFDALIRADCLQAGSELPEQLTPELRAAVQLFGAKSQSKLYALQIENILAVVDNFNVPGIAFDYPNWACKLPVTIREMADDQEFTDLFSQIQQARGMTMTRNDQKASQGAYPQPDSAERLAIDNLFFARFGDPFAYLGKHYVEGVGNIVRVLRPDADSARLINRETGQSMGEMQVLDDRGMFLGVLPEGVHDYLVEISNHDTTYRFEDPYRFSSRLAELDSWLLGEGRHNRPYEAMGAHPMNHEGVDGVNFSLWAPNAHRVSVVGEFNQWDGRINPMRFHPENGIWEVFLPGVQVNQLYKFELLDANGDVRSKSDPYAFAAELRPGTASVVRGLPEKVQRDERRSRANGIDQPISIYEVHLGSWARRPENNFWLTYEQFADQLIGYVKDMGFTHIELLPISEFPFDGSWGYQATSIYAPTSRFGSPDELRMMIEKAHDAGINVILDWVVGHFPTDDHGLRRFDGTALYEHQDEREGFHQDWNTLIYNFGRYEVQNYLRGNALYWIERFGFDGIRVDAVASMVYRDYSREEGQWIPNQFGGRENLEAVEFLNRTNTLLKDEANGATSIAEESTAFPGVTKAEGLNFDYKWNMGWMNDTLRYMKEDPVHRKYHHNLMTFGMVYQYSENYILPLSHDEVVHGKHSLLDRMPGDAWQKFANLRADYGFMYGYPGKKLMFMGSEFAQGREWNYQEALDWFLLDYDGEDNWHRGMQRWVRDLNHVYRDSPELYQLDQWPEGFDWLVVDDSDSSVFIFERRDREGNVILVISNFTPVVREPYRFGVNQPGTYKAVLNSDDNVYCGGGVGVNAEWETQQIHSHGREHSLEITIPPLATIFLKREG